MTNNEYELFDIICESENPEQSVLVAIKIFSAYVKPHEAIPMLHLASLQESF